MPRLSYLFLFFLLFGCAKGITDEDLPKLNGYWEIKKVVFADGNTKTYSVNPTIDYFKLDGYVGYRKKVQPTFGGTYDTSNDAEPFSVVEIEERFYIMYHNDLSKWSEQILALDDGYLSVVNEDGVQYHYKKFEPISAENNE